ncbi:YbaB/EbfC family nucleoid-associated protein [Rickettsia endosymbiont of Cardiosporidium cionae]|uniref:YbaB/EbfC family nucleoid-associated protein n=1 Tax=Rickettsia endosymbiont of Cardiosporidium cionae TaxID=2777155 RepID=UPI00189487E6|nr:YbaB/EbfC family nucleoid-associated protein [Rickettsia endosymbiont of Cardiosporidium cionae]KAF8818679.1 YbaB/EbfC family nucleoid-associated protein [Rickettsia endosymbiont of Cardiosporidium cionae]
MDISQILKQGENIQKKMQAIQQDLVDQEFFGSSGGELVNLSISGNSEIKSLKIDDSLLDVEKKEILEDLIIAAYNNAKSKLNLESKDQFAKNFTNISGMPQGFKFPFL